MNRAERNDLVAVDLGFEWSILLDAEVVRLEVRELCQLDTQVTEVKASHLLIQLQSPTEHLLATCQLQVIMYGEKLLST